MRAFLQAICILSATSAFADEPWEAMERKKFFADSKQAKLIDGQLQDCCGPADAMRVMITGNAPGGIRVTVIDPMRHPKAKRGDKIIVPSRRMARTPVAPGSMGTILFMDAGMTVSYCLMAPAGI